MVKVKICCISSIEEAQMAIDCGADILGLVGPMPSGPGIISNELIAEISRFCPDHIKTFLLTSETTAEAIIHHHGLVQTTSIQIVDRIPISAYQIIRSQLPEVELIQVVHVIDENSVLYASQISEHVDAILLDSGTPNAKIKILGGTGLTHNWSLSKRIVANLNKNVYLAGGLKYDNVSEAIDEVNPFGIDLCSGVRTNKKLDPTKLKQFIKKAKRSD